MLELLRLWKEIKTFLEDRNVNVTKLITDVEQLIKDAPPVVADVEAIIADLSAAPATALDTQATAINWANVLAFLEKVLPVILPVIIPLLKPQTKIRDKKMEKLTGALPARHKLAAAKPFEAAGTIPDNYITPVKKWSIWLNDQFGDCVTAEECANIDCAFNDIIDDTDLKAWCKKHNLLNGADLPQVMELMVSDPLPALNNKYSDGGYLSVDWTNETLLRAAIYQCQASVKIGVAASQLQNTDAGNHDGWVLTGARKDRNLDHCVGLVGYGTAQTILSALGATVPKGLDPNTKGYALFTWGTVGFIDQASLNAICGEAYVRNPTSLKNGNPPTPPVPPTPTPTPVPVPPPPTPDPVPTPTPTPVPIDWLALLKMIIALLQQLLKEKK